MVDLQTILSAIDELPNDDFEKVYQHVVERRAEVTAPVRHTVPPENLARLDALMRPVQEQAAQMSEAEVFAAIDEAIAAVRHD